MRTLSTGRCSNFVFTASARIGKQFLAHFFCKPPIKIDFLALCPLQLVGFYVKNVRQNMFYKTTPGFAEFIRFKGEKSSFDFQHFWQKLVNLILSLSSLCGNLGSLKNCFAFCYGFIKGVETLDHVRDHSLFKVTVWQQCIIGHLPK